MRTRRLLPAAVLVALVCAGCSSTANGRAVPEPGSRGVAPDLVAADYPAVLPDLRALDPELVSIDDAEGAKAVILQIFTGDPGSGGLRYTPPSCAGAGNPFLDAGSSVGVFAERGDDVYFVVVGAAGVPVEALRARVTGCAATTVTSAARGDRALTYDAGSDLVVPDVGQVPLVRTELTARDGTVLRYTSVVGRTRGVSVLAGITSNQRVSDDALRLVQTMIGTTLTTVASR